MRQTRLQLPPQLEDPALYEWLRKVGQAIGDLQNQQVANDSIVIEQGVGAWNNVDVEQTTEHGTFDVPTSATTSLAPVVVGMQLVGVTAFGFNPASSIRQLTLTLTESLDETGQEKLRHSTKSSSTEADGRWVVDFAGSDSGLPRRVRQGRRLALEVAADASAGTESHLSLIRWTFRTNAETDYRHTAGRRA